MRGFKEQVGICPAEELGKGSEAEGTAGGMKEGRCDTTV